MEHSVVNVRLAQGNYDIVVGNDLISQAGNHVLKAVRADKICIVSDEEVSKYHLFKVMRSFINAGYNVANPIVIPAGELTKNFKDLQFVINEALSYGLTKKSAIIALGGGMIMDIAGLAASIIHGGIGFVQIPTTLMAQVDSTVGGGNGINTNNGRNTVNNPYNPNYVLIDIDTLATLPKRELMSGYSEIVKFALINNPKFFEWLDKHSSQITSCDKDALRYAVELSCKIKSKILKQDEKDEGAISEVLNFGHNFGNAIEQFCNYDNSCLHGESVSIGMVMAYEFSCDMGICPMIDVANVRAHFEGVGLMTNPPFAITADDMLELMLKNRKRESDGLDLVLAGGIGKAFICKNVDINEIKTFLRRKLG